MGIIKKILYMILGIICIIFGAIASLIPLVPGVVLFGFAGACFAKGSRRFKNWFVGTKIYKKYLEKYMKDFINK